MLLAMCSIPLFEEAVAADGLPATTLNAGFEARRLMQRSSELEASHPLGIVAIVRYRAQVFMIFGMLDRVFFRWEEKVLDICQPLEIILASRDYLLLID